MSDYSDRTPLGHPVGQVETTKGVVAAIRADGTRVILEVGDPVFQGDVLETGSYGAVGLVMVDGTLFSMAEDGHMLLDEMVYDAGSGDGAFALSVVKGVFTFVSGEIAKADPEAMTVSTPVGTIGIRGTQGGIDLADGETLTVVLMPEADGTIGEIVLTIGGAAYVLNQADFAVTASRLTGEVMEPYQMTAEQIIGVFSKAVAVSPGSHGGVNTYGVEPGADAGEADEADADEALDELTEFETAAGEDEPDVAIQVVYGDVDYTLADDTLTVGDLTFEVEPVDGGDTEPQESGADVGGDEGNEDDPVDGPLAGDPPDEDPGDTPDEEPGDDPGDGPGGPGPGGDEDPGENPGEDPGEDPGENPDDPDDPDCDTEIIGTSGDDVLRGTSGDDGLFGLRGDDRLLGRAGDDVLVGGKGDDELRGQAGDDVLDGGKGDDELVGGRGDDDLDGGKGDDVLVGAKGDDVLDGGKGDDQLDGGHGQDELDGGRGFDVLVGGKGDDVLEGGRGDDLLTGGRGGDIFLFAKRDGEDTITDFDVGDEIVLAGFAEGSMIAIERDGDQTTITGRHLDITLEDQADVPGYTVTEAGNELVIAVSAEP